MHLQFIEKIFQPISMYFLFVHYEESERRIRIRNVVPVRANVICTRIHKDDYGSIQFKYPQDKIT